MPRLLLVLCFHGFIFSCAAQFNDTTHYHFKYLSAGIINKTDNSDSYVFNNAFNFNTQYKRLAYNTSVTWIYGTSQNTLTNNDLAAHGDVNFYKHGNKLYYWGLINFDKSYSLKITYRLQAGVGLAYNFIDSPAIKINVSDGFIYEKGNLIDATLGANIYDIPRNSLRLSYRFDLLKRIHIDGIHFYQPSLLALNDYIIQSTNNISVKLKDWLSLTASLVYNKVSRTQRENLLVTYGLTFEKYF